MASLLHLSRELHQLIIEYMDRRSVLRIGTVSKDLSTWVRTDEIFKEYWIDVVRALTHSSKTGIYCEHWRTPHMCPIHRVGKNEEFYMMTFNKDMSTREVVALAVAVGTKRFAKWTAAQEKKLKRLRAQVCELEQTKEYVTNKKQKTRKA